MADLEDGATRESTCPVHGVFRVPIAKKHPCCPQCGRFAIKVRLDPKLRGVNARVEGGNVELATVGPRRPGWATTPATIADHLILVGRTRGYVDAVNRIPTESRDCGEYWAAAEAANYLKASDFNLPNDELLELGRLLRELLARVRKAPRVALTLRGLESKVAQVKNEYHHLLNEKSRLGVEVARLEREAVDCRDRRVLEREATNAIRAISGLRERLKGAEERGSSTEARLAEAQRRIERQEEEIVSFRNTIDQTKSATEQASLGRHRAVAELLNAQVLIAELDQRWRRAVDSGLQVIEERDRLRKQLDAIDLRAYAVGLGFKSWAERENEREARESGALHNAGRPSSFEGAT